MKSPSFEEGKPHMMDYNYTLASNLTIDYHSNFSRFLEEQIHQDNLTSCIFRKMAYSMAESFNATFDLRLRGKPFMPSYGRQISKYMHFVGSGSLSGLGIIGNFLVIIHFIKQYYKNLSKMSAYYFLLMIS